MGKTNRERILRALRMAPAKTVPGSPEGRVREVTAADGGGLADMFCGKLAEQTGLIYRSRGSGDAVSCLCGIFREHRIDSAVTSCDPVIEELDLVERGRREGLCLFVQNSFSERDAFREAVFDKADAGITGADFGVAETGTLVLSFGKDHARLISLAPNIHIVFLSADRLVATYEDAFSLISKRDVSCSQTVLITGPSMTADIQGRPFKGMHGPQKLITILVGQPG